MKKRRKVFTVAMLALVLSLALIGPAGASDPIGAGFDVDCTGATGYGLVPAHTTYIWSVTLNDPAFEEGYENWISWVSGGETGAPFEVVIEWGIAPTPGASSYVWNVWTEDESYCNSGSGCLECFQGCTPGYWRNLRKHGDEWTAAGYAPADDFDATFGVDLFEPDITLEQAVWARGGKANKLARHGTAALLSAAHSGVIYPYTVPEVIAYVQAGDVEPLVEANESFCPLN